MPSTTPNYGWTYPISSDDLNAGATSIGSLATGADASLKTLSNTVASIDAAKPNCNFDNIEFAWVTTTTNSVGQFTLAQDVSSYIIGPARSLYAVTVIRPEASPSTTYTVFSTGLAGGSLTLLINASITFMLARVWS